MGRVWCGWTMPKIVRSIYNHMPMHDRLITITPMNEPAPPLVNALCSMCAVRCCAVMRLILFGRAQENDLSLRSICLHRPGPEMVDVTGFNMLLICSSFL